MGSHIQFENTDLQQGPVSLIQPAAAFYNNGFTGTQLYPFVYGLCCLWLRSYWSSYHRDTQPAETKTFTI